MAKKNKLGVFDRKHPQPNQPTRPHGNINDILLRRFGVDPGSLGGPLGKGFGTPGDSGYFVNPFTPGNGNVGSFDASGASPYTASMQKFFDTLLNGGGNSMDALLAFLGKDKFSPEEWSMFLQYMLQHGYNQDQRNYDQSITHEQREYDQQLLKDQRQYDWNLLQDQRAYDSPLNQLQRLMGAGIGRDAAISMLSGSGASAGAGSASVPYGSPTEMAAANAPSPSGTPGSLAAQTAIGTTNAVVNAIGTLTDAGLSIAQGVETVRGMRMQNNMSQLQLQAYTSANDFVNQLQMSGLDLSQYSNGQDLIKYLQAEAVNNNEIAASLVNSPAFAGTFGSLAGRDFFNSFWDSARKHRDSGTIADNFLRQQDLQNALSAVSIDKIGSEMSLIGSQQNEIEQRIIESCSRVAQINADIQVKNRQGDWIQVQTKNYERLVDSQIDLNYSQSYLADEQSSLVALQTAGQDIQNNINTDIFELNHAGFPMMRDAHIIECERELRKLRLLNDPDGQKLQLQQWAVEQQNAVKLAYLEQIYNTSAGDFIARHPSLYALATGYHMCGAGDLVQSGASSAAAGANVLSAGAKILKMIK